MLDPPSGDHQMNAIAAAVSSLATSAGLGAFAWVTGEAQALALAIMFLLVTVCILYLRWQFPPEER